MNAPSNPVAGIVIGALLLLMYFIPSMVAQTRRHRNKDPVFVINLFLGWTFLGWVVALAWAFTDHVHPKASRRDEAAPRPVAARRDPRL